jgi:hypothetical protein
MNRKKTPLASLAALALVFGLARSASGAELLLHAGLPAGATPTGARFDADREHGAWVVVAYHVEDPIGEGGPRVEEKKIVVPGLAYDAARHAVVLKDGGGDVVCAVRKRILFATTFRETPACRLRLRSGERTADGDAVLVELATVNRMTSTERGSR